MVPDWQLPPGVDRGLHDYIHSAEMAAGYDAQMASSLLAQTDIRFCEQHFQPGRLIDIGCGTGRLCRHFSPRGFECIGVDLSDEMLAAAKAAETGTTWIKSNIVEMREFEDCSFENAACLFSTLGMVRGGHHRAAVIRNVYRILKPGGVFVLHAHNRWFGGLGWRRFRTDEFTMPQAYGGAPLTIHHFSKREVRVMLDHSGFSIREVKPICTNEKPALWPWRVYGYLTAAVKPV